MKTILIEKEVITPEVRDELAGVQTNFELKTKCEVKKIRGFEKKFLGKRGDWNHYLFTKSVQMGTRAIHRPGGME